MWGVWSPSAFPVGWRVEQIPDLQGTLEIPQKRHSYCMNQQTHPWEVKGTLKFFYRVLLYFLAQTQGQPLALEVTSGPNNTVLFLERYLTCIFTHQEYLHIQALVGTQCSDL